jgi:hypothetical protein
MAVRANPIDPTFAHANFLGVRAFHEVMHLAIFAMAALAAATVLMATAVFVAATITLFAAAVAEKSVVARAAGTGKTDFFANALIAVLGHLLGLVVLMANWNQTFVAAALWAAGAARAGPARRLAAARGFRALRCHAEGGRHRQGDRKGCHLQHRNILRDKNCVDV